MVDIFQLTGQPVSDELKDIIETLKGGTPVAHDTIMSTPEIILAENIMATIGKTNINDSARESLRDNILDKMLDYGSASYHPENIIDGKEPWVYDGIVDKGSRLDIIIGLPASGKSSAILNSISEEYHSRLIDNDEAKKLFPEFNNGWGASAVHEESQAISDAAFEECLVNRDNIVLPKVGSNSDKLISNYISKAKALGYTVNVHYVELDRNKALSRMLERFCNVGRYLEPGLIQKYAPYINGHVQNYCTEAYNELKLRPDMVDGYSLWNNDVPMGEKPILIEHHGLNDRLILEAEKRQHLTLLAQSVTEYIQLHDADHYAFEVSVTGFNDTEYKNNVYNNLINGKIDGYIYRLEHIDVTDNDLSALVRDGLLGELRQADLEYKEAIENGKNRIFEQTNGIFGSSRGSGQEVGHSDGVHKQELDGVHESDKSRATGNQKQDLSEHRLSEYPGNDDSRGQGTIVEAFNDTFIEGKYFVTLDFKEVEHLWDDGITKTYSIFENGHEFMESDKKLSREEIKDAFISDYLSEKVIDIAEAYAMEGKSISEEHLFIESFGESRIHDFSEVISDIKEAFSQYDGRSTRSIPLTDVMEKWGVEPVSQVIANTLVMNRYDQHIPDKTLEWALDRVSPSKIDAELFINENAGVVGATAQQIFEFNPLAKIEELEEGNYNMIDAIPNNGFGEKAKKEEERKELVFTMKGLKADFAEKKRKEAEEHHSHPELDVSKKPKSQGIGDD